MELSDADFNALRGYILKVCGINLGDEKKYLVTQRLTPVMRAQGCADFTEFVKLISRFSDERLRSEVISAITTNETFFFRDGHPFEMFRKILLPVMCEWAISRKQRAVVRKGSKVSILSAGSSTGQEPYTLSMIIHDHLKAGRPTSLMPEDFSITATDISSRVLAQAMAGEYTDLEIRRGLNDELREAHFTKEGGKWVVREPIRNLVEFRKVNLMEPFLHLGGYDVIFCRNVLIYFDEAAKRRILDQFHSMLADGGFLVLGATENTYGITDRFESRHAGGSVLYVKKQPVLKPVTVP